MKLISPKEPEGDDDMMVLNVRGVPAKLVWECRRKAAERRMTLKDFVIQTLEQAVDQKSKR